MLLKGTALVTGAAQGIGRAIALRLADDGFNVAVNDIASKKGIINSLAEEIVAKGRQSLAVIADVSAEHEVKTLVETVTNDLGGLDVVSGYPKNCFIRVLKLCS